ncbi:MAG: dihydrofolate reductase [Lentimicrobiaceae bacterium]|nr:dihydrofolate reductase [Lentimicrobiaceae bacterium]MCB9023730.1 dihydrofolate reductase [Lentimicrobiaceae bacterium]MCO5266237.1 dihydrofolate reductase [Lentimicrobium sp.]
MKPISIIVAIAKNYAIGKDNQLLWHIPQDLKRFKALTTGHTIVMGKRTFESLPLRPLPNRRSVVITDIADEVIEGCEMAYSIQDAIDKMEENRENFIIGGGMVYKQFMPLAHKLYLTIVHHEFEADTFYDEIDYSQWNEVEREDISAKDSLGFDYSYVTLERRQS